METRTLVYNDKISRQFVAASVFWGLAAMTVGVVIALQLAFWQGNVAPFLSYGRLRPLHTNAAIFAFVGNMIFAGIYYSTQRLVKARLASDRLGSIHFWGWQAIIVAALVTLPLGFTQGKEYAELEWPIDIAIAGVWVVFAVNFFWTLARRNEKHLYVAIWFYIATIVTVAVLHIVNSFAIPVGLLKSYSLFGGAQDALVQWWYGHNAVAFFLTTPVLGIMYYYLPKAADRPVYSYRLSIIHFWALVFIYIWAGPHHLLNTALPDWAQTLGMIFSLMLWAPSWGGMLNGLLTLRGAWDKVRQDPVLKMFAAAVTFYGMATFEGPLLSIKSVSGLAHYTDWIIGHVHSGALGWNGFMAAGMFYWMVPRLFGTKLHSRSMANAHFYLGTIGILLYMVAMWVSGVTQGLMWKAENPSGGLMYPSFVETLLAILPMYYVRALGGAMYLVGMVLMAVNLWKTVRAGKAVDGTAEVIVAPAEKQISWSNLLFKPAPIVVVLVVGLATVAGFLDAIGATGMIFLATLIGVLGWSLLSVARKEGEVNWHRLLEGKPLLFTVLAVIAVLIGGIAEIIPTIVITKNDPRAAMAHPYRPLELEGRDIYIREGCYTCHSQMIRPFVAESMRYGAPSTLEESILDHPFQWGSKRTGPDLARIGRKYPSSWHYYHMTDPRSTSPGSNMPPYAFLSERELDPARTAGKVYAMQKIGVPYAAAEVAGAAADAQTQAQAIADELKESGIDVNPRSEMVALIAYLQSLGKKPKPGVAQLEGTSP